MKLSLPLTVIKIKTEIDCYYPFMISVYFCLCFTLNQLFSLFNNHSILTLNLSSLKQCSEPSSPYTPPDQTVMSDGEDLDLKEIGISSLVVFLIASLFIGFYIFKKISKCTIMLTEKNKSYKKFNNGYMI